MRTKSKESATRKKIDLMLKNLSWNTDEESPDCNVFTERAKLVEQSKKFKGYEPDYVIYQSGTDTPIAIIEAKRKGQKIDQAIEEACKKYADPLGVKIVFAYDGAFFKSWHTKAKKELFTDGIAVTQLLTEKKLLRFIAEGHSISELTPAIKHSRSELITIFQSANNLLRKEGLREGIERFSEFANLLFLKLISEMEKDRATKGEKRILDDEYCWDAFADLDATMMMRYINNTVLPHLVAEYNDSGDVFQNRLLIQKPKTLEQIVKKLSATNFIDTDSDVKGDAFEYFLRDSITVGNDLGEYFTPRHLVKLMIELVEPKFGEKVYDCACGTAGFLISSFNYIKKRSAMTKANFEILKEDTIYGGEITSTAKIAKMNMILAGDGHTNIKQLDSLENPIDGEYDVCLSNPPYGQTTDFGDFYPVPSNNGDSVFIQHIYKSLKDSRESRAAVVIPEGLLFREDMKDVRKFLLKNTSIIAVISLPRGVFRPYVKENKTDIIVFKKGHPEGTKSVWFYNLEADGFDLTSDFRKPVPENDIPDLLGKWNDKAESSKSWNVDIEKIIANNYKLIAKDYQPKEMAIESHFPVVKFSSIMREVKQGLVVDEEKEYVRITAKYHGGGIQVRDRIKGKNLKVKRQKIIKGDQLLVAEIDAKNGSYGVVPSDLDGAIVSSHYFLFELDKSKVRPKYLDYVMRFGHYEELIKRFVKGTTNYADIRSTDVLRLMIPLPSSLLIQDEIIDKISRQVRIKDDAEKMLHSLEEAAIDDHFFKSQTTKKLPEKVEIDPKYKLTPNSSKFFVEMAALDELRGRISNFKEVESKSSGLTRFKDNDILFGRITPCTENGKIGIVNGLGGEVGLGSTEFVVISPKSKSGIDPEWLYYYLKSHEVRKQAINSMNGTTGRKRVSKKFFEELNIPILPHSEQVAQAKELRGYTEVKDGLTKAIKLSEAAIDNILLGILKIDQKTVTAAKPTTLNDYLA